MLTFCTVELPLQTKDTYAALSFVERFISYILCPYLYVISASDISVYEEVEPFTGARPVIICGVLANRIADSLTESYPGMYYQCKNGWSLCNKNSYYYFDDCSCSEFLEGTARITEARLNRERSEGKIIDYQRVKDSGYRVISNISFSSRENKVLYNNYHYFCHCT